MSEGKKGSFVDYSNETEEITIEKLMEKGYSSCQAEAYLSKLNIKKLFENDNDCKNIDFNPELYIPQARIEIIKPKRIKRNRKYG